MSKAQTENFARAMALIKLAEGATREIGSGDIDLADSVYVSLGLAMELLEADHNDGGSGAAKRGV